jgi:hypothetical protein
VQHLKDFWSLYQTLDEKEAHLFIYYTCKNGWKCAEADVETVLADLVKLRGWLSADIRSDIEGAVKKAISAKETIALKRVKKTWKRLTDKQKSFFIGDGQENPKSFINALQQMNISVFDSGDFVGAEPKVELKKDGSGCGIGIPSSYAGAIEAAIFAVQMQNNPSLCFGIFKAGEIEARFKSGVISRDEFEQQVLD